MNWWDIVILLVTGLVALYLVWRFFQHYGKSPSSNRFDIYYIISFLVLLVAGLLLIFLTYDVLGNKLVIIVAALIPLGLSLGLVTEFWPRYEKSYMYFAIVGFVALALTRYTGPDWLATLILIIVHAIAGLLVFLLPILAVSKGKAKPSFYWVAVGGALIGVGGIALAFLKNESQLLFFSASLVFDILAPLLLLMTLAYAWGFTKKMLS